MRIVYNGPHQLTTPEEKKMSNSNIIVTRESLQQLLENENPRYVMDVIGRALVHIFNRQTKSEQSSNDTKEANNVGFAGCDARSGSIHAKFYIKNKKLDRWMIDKWLEKGKNDYSRLTKYHRQLNEIAVEKSQQRK